MITQLTAAAMPVYKIICLYVINDDNDCDCYYYCYYYYLTFFILLWIHFLVRTTVVNVICC